MPNVKLLLKDNVEELGNIGDIVSVKPGYARNYLLPNGFATLPTPGEVKQIEKKKALLQKQFEEEKAQAEEVSKKLSDIGKIEFSAEAGEAGKLFGRITAKDIVEKIKSEHDIKIDRKQIQLKKSIGELGEFDINIKLHADVMGQIKVIVKQSE